MVTLARGGVSLDTRLVMETLGWVFTSHGDVSLGIRAYKANHAGGRGRRRRRGEEGGGGGGRGRRRGEEEGGGGRHNISM
jgi:hypothetical protein